MYDDMKKRCTGVGSGVHTFADSLEKLGVIGAIVIAALGLITSLLTKDYTAVINYLIIAFVFVLAINVITYILHALGDIAINSEISARISADENAEKMAAIKKFNAMEEPKSKSDEDVDSNSNNGAFKPFAGNANTKKQAVKKPVEKKVEKPTEPEPEEEVEEEVKEEPVVTKNEPQKSPFGGSSAPVAKPANKQSSNGLAKPASGLSGGLSSGSGLSGGGLSGGGLSSGSGLSTANKLPGAGEDLEPPKTTTVNKSFTPFPIAKPADKEEVASPFKPLASKEPAEKKEEKKEEKPQSSSPFTPFTPVKKEESAAPSPFKPVAAAKEEPAEEKPAAASPFTPFAPVKKEEDAPSPFKPAANNNNSKPASAESGVSSAKLNKLHMCPSCNVMVSSNPCPRCGYEIIIDENAEKNKEIEANKEAANPKSNINKLHKCSNCGRITKTDPCEHCGV